MKIFLKSKLVSLDHEIDITNESDEVIYKVTSKFISLKDKTVLVNAKTNEVVCEIHRKPISIHETYYVDMTNGVSFELSTEILKIVNTEIDINGLGWKITGNMLQHDFSLVDDSSNVVASSHKAWVSLHEAFEIEIVDESKLDTIVAIFAVLDHIMTTRDQNDAYVASSISDN